MESQSIIDSTSRCCKVMVLRGVADVAMLQASCFTRMWFHEPLVWRGVVSRCFFENVVSRGVASRAFGFARRFCEKLFCEYVVLQGCGFHENMFTEGCGSSEPLVLRYSCFRKIHGSTRFLFSGNSWFRENNIFSKLMVSRDSLGLLGPVLHGFLSIWSCELLLYDRFTVI